MPEGIEQPTKKSSDYIMRASAMKKSKDKDGDLDLLKKDDKKAGMQEHQVYQIMFRQLIQQRTQNEYEEYAKRIEEAGGTPEKSLYRAYVAEQTALGKEPSKFIQWNTHRIVAIFKEEDPDVKERVAATLKAYRDGDIYKISPDTEDEDESHPETDEEANKDDEEHEKGILFRSVFFLWFLPNSLSYLLKTYKCNPKGAEQDPRQLTRADGMVRSIPRRRS